MLLVPIERAEEANKRLVETTVILDRIRDKLECSIGGD